MAVFYNSISGEYHTASQSLNPAQEADFLAYESLLHAGIGWHEYASVAAMDAAVQANNSNPHSKTKWPTPTSNAITGAETAGGKTVKNATSGLTNWTLNATGIGGWFVRGMKVLFGGMLIILGISRLTGADNKVVQLASKVPVIPV